MHQTSLEPNGAGTDFVAKRLAGLVQKYANLLKAARDAGLTNAEIAGATSYDDLIQKTVARIKMTFEERLAADKRLVEIVRGRTAGHVDLTPEELEELAALRRSGKISDKDMRKAGLTREQIRDINERAKNQGRKLDPGGHDRSKIVETIEGTRRLLDEALEKMAQYPHDQAAQIEVERLSEKLDALEQLQAETRVKNRRIDR